MWQKTVHIDHPGPSTSPGRWAWRFRKFEKRLYGRYLAEEHGLGASAATALVAEAT
jgi:hypothetical protein